MQISLYLTAAATAFGALLTVVVQAMVSAVQRRNERIARMFDVRLELYTKTRRALSDWLGQYHAISQLKLKLEEDLKRRENEVAILRVKIEKFLSEEPRSPGPAFGETVTATQETAKQLLREIEDYQARSTDNLEQMQKTQAVAADRLGKLFAARDEIQKLSHEIPLLASKSVNETLEEVFDKVLSYTKSIKSGNESDCKLDFDKFDQAVRKELGVEF